MMESGPARLHSAAVPILQQQQPVNGRISYESVSSVSSFRLSVGSGSSGETDIQYIKASELFPKKSPWVEDATVTTQPPFPLLPGECIVYEGRTVEGSLYISNYRLYLCKSVNSESVNGTGSLSGSNGKDVNVPLGLIETMECKDIFYLNLCCKDARSFRLVFLNGESCQDWAKRLIQLLSVPRRAEDVFSLAFYAWARDSEENLSSQQASVPWWRRAHQDTPVYGEELFRSEIERQGYDTSVTWRVSVANLDFKLCTTYPSHILVPTSISDDKLEAVASYRSVRRLPAVVWRNRRNGAVLARCSQPEVGWLGWRSTEDENLLRAILDACFYDSGQLKSASAAAAASSSMSSSSSLASRSSENAAEEWSSSVSDPAGVTVNGAAAAAAAGADVGSPLSANECGSLKDLSEDSSCFTEDKKKMLIIDARSYATAVANRARGGGCEFPQYYPQCDIEFMNLANIHAVRKSFLLLRTLCLTAANPQPSADQSNWFTQLDSTRWLHHMANLLRASWYTAVNLHDHGRPVLVHCSDGWDRTPQIVSLAQLMIDPFYRTVRGFQVLVQREWLEFGHKFADRCGLLGGCDDLNERCPVFVQFLDCVHQLMQQFPTAFQFNDAYLVKMVQHVYSNLFGTFLWNTVQERVQHRIAERSHSLWTFLLDKSSDLCNYLYQDSEQPLWPSYQVRDLHFWSRVYLADFGGTSCQAEGCGYGSSCGVNSASATTTISTAPASVAPSSVAAESSLVVHSNVSSNSPCSSGYATPQQTALTDSMVDTLPWRSFGLGGDDHHHQHHHHHPPPPPPRRNVMEESTDTIVDDRPGHGGVSSAGADHHDDDGHDFDDSFPLLEPIAVVGSVDDAPSPPPPAPESSRVNGRRIAVVAADEEEPSEDMAALYRSKEDCPTCLQNWDLLKRKQSSAEPAAGPSPMGAGVPTPAYASCLNFDLDGLMPCVDRQQIRLRQILAAKDMELEALRKDLHQTRVALCRQVCHSCNSTHRSAGGHWTHHATAGEPSAPCPAGDDDDDDDDDAGDDDRITGDPADKTFSSISSWENVTDKEIIDKDSPATLWVPDHAAPMCMKCSVPFWIGRRRHHCRNCGKIYCADCAGQELPLPHQNLYQAVRVCNVCYESLMADACSPTTTTTTTTTSVTPTTTTTKADHRDDHHHLAWSGSRPISTRSGGGSGSSSGLPISSKASLCAAAVASNPAAAAACKCCLKNSAKFKIVTAASN